MQVTHSFQLNLAEASLAYCFGFYRCIFLCISMHYDVPNLRRAKVIETNEMTRNDVKIMMMTFQLEIKTNEMTRNDVKIMMMTFQLEIKTNEMTRNDVKIMMMPIQLEIKSDVVSRASQLLITLILVTNSFCYTLYIVCIFLFILLLSICIASQPNTDYLLAIFVFVD